MYNVGGEVSAPVMVHSVNPKFSKLARKRKLTAVSLVQCVVDTDGLPQQVSLARSAGEGKNGKDLTAALSLDEEAIQAVRQYRFKPAVRQGVAVPVKSTSR